MEIKPKCEISQTIFGGVLGCCTFKSDPNFSQLPRYAAGVIPIPIFSFVSAISCFRSTLTRIQFVRGKRFKHPENNSDNP
ncbi:MAG: hypothetical protein HQM08_12130 [Candidatus Riflebacteria bacterium]|nr:hypothetical protein [Candidatus Riflebacteria bacterium]